LGLVAMVALVAVFAHGASAQGATGTITGRVLWGNCIRAIPLPAAPDAQAQPGMPQPVPVPTSGLPAGAVLVAVQNTAISARTDEAGSFTLSGVPAGQYLTVAAGPVANASSAIAERPNVFVSGGQTVDVGTLSLGGSPTPLGIACRVVPGVSGAPGPETVPPAPGTAPVTPNTPPSAPDSTPPAPDSSDSTP
jgi:hypothetical protein